MSVVVVDPATGNQFFTVGASQFSPNIREVPGEITWIEILNESPYLLFAQMGSLIIPIPAWYGYPIQSPDGGGFNLPLSLSPLLLGSTVNAPSTVCVVTVYGPGERPAQVTPYPLVRQANIANQVSVTNVSSVIQDNQPNGQTVVEATPTGQPQNVLITTDGVAVFRGAVTFGPGTPTATANLGTLRHTTTGNGYVLSPAETGAAQGGLLGVWDGAARQFPLGLGITTLTPGTRILVGGAFSIVAGQATAGNFGLPPIVASVLDQHVTVTTQQTIISTTLTPGVYELSGVVAVNDVTTPAAINVAFQYTDKVGSQIDHPLARTNNGAAVMLDGTARAVPNSYNLITQSFEVVSGTFTLTYTNSTGTPNDFVSMFIKRLA